MLGLRTLREVFDANRLAQLWFTFFRKASGPAPPSARRGARPARRMLRSAGRHRAVEGWGRGSGLPSLAEHWGDRASGWFYPKVWDQE